MLEEKYQTLVLSVKKNTSNQPDSVGHSGYANYDSSSFHQGPMKSSKNITRTVTVEQVLKTVAIAPARGRLRVGILVFPDVQVLDCCGPSEVFSATRLLGRATETETTASTSPFQVILVAESVEHLVCHGGMEIMPHADFESCPELDIFLVPGGIGAGRLRYHSPAMEFISVKGKECKILGAVSSGVLLLAQAGLLNGRHVATHRKDLDTLQNEFGQSVLVESSLVWVQHGKIFTGAEGIDVSLKIVQQIFGETVARATAKHMEHGFPETNVRRTVEDDDHVGQCELRCSIM